MNFCLDRLLKMKFCLDRLLKMHLLVRVELVREHGQVRGAEELQAWRAVPGCYAFGLIWFRTVYFD